MMNISVVFLCKDLTRSLAAFANEIIDKTNYSVWVVVDNEESVKQKFGYFDKFMVFTCPDEECIINGYSGANINGEETHIKKRIIAWDKFLYKFCNSTTEDHFYWVFEEDVFIPSIDTIKNLTEKYSKNDLVVPSNFHKSYSANDWHWPHIINKIGPPYFHSMVSACGMSNKMLEEIRKFVEHKRTLFHIEALFNTIAMQTRTLNVADPLELKSVVWKGKWEIDEFLLLPNNVFHPVKENDTESVHSQYRLDIKRAKESGYKPINTLPDFIRRLMK